MIVLYAAIAISEALYGRKQIVFLLQNCFKNTATRACSDIDPVFDLLCITRHNVLENDRKDSRYTCHSRSKYVS